MVLIDGAESETLSVWDRGLSYGDGIYRTVELKHGKPRLWRWQYARLVDDAARLRLPLPAEDVLLEELNRLGQGLPWAVGKIMLTRGVGARGYGMPPDPHPTRIVMVSSWSGYPAEYGEQGVTVRWCETRLAVQSRLAGIKHLNRLENVLARSEWDNPSIVEGLMLDTQGRLTEGTMSNVYLLQGDRIVTPSLRDAGVNGAVRDWLAATAGEWGLVFVEAELHPDDVQNSDALFLSNSLLGICPVRQLGERIWSVSKRVQQLRRAWLMAD